MENPPSLHNYENINAGNKSLLQRYQSTSYLTGSRKLKKKPSSINVATSSQQVPLMDESDEKKLKLFNPQRDLIECKNMILGNKINLLLVFVPFGFISYYCNWKSTITFFINFLAMIPVANILGDSTECLADHLGETIGGLLNATFGNAVEIVVMILALVKARSFQDSGEIENSKKMLIVVQSSLIGSIFSNSLLVLGCSFVANGIFYKDSSFNIAATSANVCLLLVASFVMILPAPYKAANETGDELMVSRAAAIILLAMYGCLLFFVLFTHKDIMEPENATLNDNLNNNNRKKKKRR